MLHKKVSDKCPQSIKGALVPHHQNTWMFLIPHVIKFSDLQSWAALQLTHFWGKRKGKYHKRDRSDRSEMHQILGQLTLGGLIALLVSADLFQSGFSVSFRRHSICQNRATWIVRGLKTNYWQRGYGTWTVIRGNKNFTDGYFKLLADSAVTQLPSQRERELGTWECCWSWSQTNSGSQRQTVGCVLKVRDEWTKGFLFG